MTPTQNHGGTILPRFIVFHYTACDFDTAKAVFLRTSGKRVSAHLLVDLDGSVAQFVPLNMRAWHAGESSWAGLTDVNTHSIGIEVVNFGYLQRTADGRFLVADGGRSIEPEEVIEVRHKHSEHPYTHWHAFTPAQIETCGELAEVLGDAYGIEDVVGHDDVARPRKQDPGPAFPLMRMRGLALSREDPHTFSRYVQVAAKKLNIRTGPSTASAPAGSPLLKGTMLRVLRSDASGWLEVEAALPTPIVGWVAAPYTTSG